MFGIFTQGRYGMNWHGNETTLERATEQLKDYDDSYLVDFAFVLPVLAFRDIDDVNKNNEPVE